MGPKSNDRCPYMERGGHRGEGLGKDRRKGWGDNVYRPRLAGSYRSWRETSKLTLGASRRNQRCRFIEAQPPELRENTLLLFEVPHLHFWSFTAAALEKQHTPTSLRSSRFHPECPQRVLVPRVLRASRGFLYASLPSNSSVEQAGPTSHVPFCRWKNKGLWARTQT